MKQVEYIIIGAGMTGLALARVLQDAGKTYLVLEASDRPGGRIKTDQFNGFLLDRGFQVYLTAYPEGLQQLDLKALDLRPFLPGARILKADGTQDLFVDPLRKWKYLFSTLKSDVGDLGDKLGLFSLSKRLVNKRNRALFQRENKDTAAILKEYGLSESVVQHFLHPFFSGIFLENDLHTSRRMFDFVFKMFSKGDGAIPALGMEQIPIQLASKLPVENFLFNSRVHTIDGKTVKVEDGRSFEAHKIVIATEAGDLVKKYKPSAKLSAESVTCIYFSADVAPFDEAIIALNTQENRLVNNIAIMSNVSPHYAPKGKALLALSINGIGHASDDVLTKVREEMKHWFGSSVEQWTHLKTYEIPYALPNQREVQYDLNMAETKISEHLYICGDHMLQGSINGAMRAGRKLGEHMLQV